MLSFLSPGHRAVTLWCSSRSGSCGNAGACLLDTEMYTCYWIDYFFSRGFFPGGSCDVCSFMAGNCIELGPVGILLSEPNIHGIKVLLQLGQFSTLFLMSASLIPKSPSHSCTQCCPGESRLTYVSEPQLCFIFPVQYAKGWSHYVQETKVLSPLSVLWQLKH